MDLRHGGKLQKEQLLVVVSSRSGSISHISAFDRLPALLNKNFADCNLMIIYPEQVDLEDMVSFSDPMGSGA